MEFIFTTINILKGCKNNIKSFNNILINVFIYDRILFLNSYWIKWQTERKNISKTQTVRAQILTDCSVEIV